MQRVRKPLNGLQCVKNIYRLKVKVLRVKKKKKKERTSSLGGRDRRISGSSKIAWSTEGVPGQRYAENLSQKTKS